MRSGRQTTRLSDRQLLTSLLIIELDDVRWSHGLEKWLVDWQPAGVLLSRMNLQTPSATAELLGRIARTMSVPPLLALRESGGSLDPLHRFFPRVPSPRAVARQGPRAARKLGDLVGAAMRMIGFNTTFGPSLDLSTPYSDLLLDNRIFSSDPEVVARCGTAFIQGLRRHGILAAPGHFPGVSDATFDDVSKLHVADKSMAEMWREDLIPYRALVRRLPFIVASHLPYKAYDFDSARPAYMSRGVLQGLLRSKLGFRGVSIADFPNTMRLLSDASTVQSNEGFAMSLSLSVFGKSLAAGCDLLITWPGEKVLELVHRALERSIASGALQRARIEEAFGRVQAARKHLRRPTGKLNWKAFEKLARECDDFAKTCRE